jgi:hypothetical protein
MQAANFFGKRASLRGVDRRGERVWFVSCVPTQGVETIKEGVICSDSPTQGCGTTSFGPTQGVGTGKGGVVCSDSRVASWGVNLARRNQIFSDSTRLMHR